ncbi:hypothetical protein [Spirosoma sp. KUDC1026]|uniref:hypothetical protein n=1 Tax=Spirosoma sp. KUDC1026 TaxID=2745947 RepID=UPI00159B8460|nr:hypothetical protein [Spirosoma sp. KUDC1026]QKZ11977.1 hypothetical protein HU175_04755 [Spirosoma sp. KUDC1026]
MRLFAFLSLLLLLFGYAAVAEESIQPEFPRQITVMDTVVPNKSRAHSNNVSTRDIKPVILPGTMLDTTFSSLPAQSSAVGKAVPGWLRSSVQGSPLYVIDGKPATASQLRNLKEKEVASTYQLEGPKAQNLYGKNARNGVFIITTKSGIAPK